MPGDLRGFSPTFDRSAPDIWVQLIPRPPQSPSTATIDALNSQLRKLQAQIADLTPAQAQQAASIQQQLAQLQKKGLIAQAQAAAKSAPPVTIPWNLDEALPVLELKFTDGAKTGKGGNKANKLELMIQDLNGDSVPLVRKGDYLAARWGYPGNMSPDRVFVITSRKAGSKGAKRFLKLEALAKSVLMHQTQQGRTFLNQTDSAIAKQILVANGYKPEELDIEATTVTREVVTQGGTDAQFLQKLAKRNGFAFYADFDGVHFVKDRFDLAAIRKFTYYTDPGMGEVLDVEVEERQVSRPGKITVVGRDPLTGKSVSAEGSNDATKRTGLSTKVDGTLAQMGTMTVNGGSITQDAAQVRADALYARASRGSYLIKAKIIGDPQIVSRTVVIFDGIGKDASGNYHLNQVVTVIKAGDYHISVEGRSDFSSGDGTQSKAKKPQGVADPGVLTQKITSTGYGDKKTVFSNTRGRKQADSQER